MPVAAPRFNDRWRPGLPTTTCATLAGTPRRPATGNRATARQCAGLRLRVLWRADERREGAGAGKTASGGGLPRDLTARQWTGRGFRPRPRLQNRGVRSTPASARYTRARSSAAALTMRAPGRSPPSGYPRLSTRGSARNRDRTIAVRQQSVRFTIATRGRRRAAVAHDDESYRGSGSIPEPATATRLDRSANRVRHMR